jgi:hypothetical protein
MPYLEVNVWGIIVLRVNQALGDKLSSEGYYLTINHQTTRLVELWRYLIFAYQLF